MIKLTIQGMTCGHCVRTVQTALAQVPGVTGPVLVDLAQGEAQVSGSASPEALLAALRAEEFQAQVAEAGDGQ